MRRPEAAVRLKRQYDEALLLRDLRVAEGFGGYVVPGNYDGLAGQYNDGEWTGVSLVAIGGRHDDASSGANPNAPFRETEVLAHTPYFKRVLDGLPFQKRSVRVSYLPPGGVIRPHVDASTLRGGMIRLHLPIVTDPNVRFMVGGRRWTWRPGELWFADVSRVHSVENLSSVTRVHLLIDGLVNDRMLELFPGRFVAQAVRFGGVLRCHRAVALPDLERFECTISVPGWALPGVGPAPTRCTVVAKQDHLVLSIEGAKRELALEPIGRATFRLVGSEQWVLRFSMRNRRVAGAEVIPLYESNKDRWLASWRSFVRKRRARQRISAGQ